MAKVTALGLATVVIARGKHHSTLTLSHMPQGGLCWSNDVWNHSFGECWLKNQRNPARPEAGAYGAYPAGYRKKHHTAPERVQWMSGSLATKKLVVDGPKWHW